MDTEKYAKLLYERQTRAWSGHVWDWSKAHDEIRAYWLGVADGTIEPSHLLPPQKEGPAQ